MFMLGMIAVILVGFGSVVWWSYRTERRRAARGESVATPGAERWSE